LGKQALSLEETKELARHADIQTTSNIYGGLSPDAKRAAQERPVEFVHQTAKKPPETAAWYSVLNCPFWGLGGDL
jgi:hypothetical protein